MGVLTARNGRLRERRPELGVVDSDTGARCEKPARRARRRSRGPAPLPAVAIAVVLLIAGAVTLQAQRVAGQDRLESVRSEMRDADRMQAELRADVAEAEAPQQILMAAGDMGMVEPAAVVPLPAPAPVPMSTSSGVVERG